MISVSNTESLHKHLYIDIRQYLNKKHSKNTTVSLMFPYYPITVMNQLMLSYTLCICLSTIMSTSELNISQLACMHSGLGQGSQTLRHCIEQTCMMTKIN